MQRKMCDKRKQSYRELKMEMCKRAIKANVCPEDCDICAWDTKGGVSYENN